MICILKKMILKIYIKEQVDLLYSYIDYESINGYCNDDIYFSCEIVNGIINIIIDCWNDYSYLKDEEDYKEYLKIWREENYGK